MSLGFFFPEFLRSFAEGTAQATGIITLIAVLSTV